MTLTTIDIENQHNAVLLDSQAYYYAKRFATEEATPEKRERVYLNTLAVYAVHNQLQLLETKTDLESSDSWHPLKRSLFDVADLVVPDLGKLECVPVMPEAESIRVSPSELKSRIAYIAVQFDNEQPDLVNLLGYVRPDNIPEGVSEILLTQLQPFEDLFEDLYELEEEQLKQQQAFNRVETSLVNLGEWLEIVDGKVTSLTDEIKAGWQTLQELFSAQPELAYCFRSAETKDDIKRVKIYHLGDRQIGLLVSIQPGTDATYYIKIQMFSIGKQGNLPSGIKLSLFNSAKKLIKQAESNGQGNPQIGLKKVKSKERFSVQISFENSSLEEEIVIDSD